MHQLKFTFLETAEFFFFFFFFWGCWGKKKKKANVLQVGSLLEPRDIKAEEHFEEMVPENGHRPCMNVI